MLKGKVKTMLNLFLIAKELSITNLFLQNKLSADILPSRFGTFMAVHPLKMINLWLDKWILHHHNNPSHTAFSVSKMNTSVGI
jgi:hypothetical protein